MLNPTKKSTVIGRTKKGVAKFLYRYEVLVIASAFFGLGYAVGRLW